jgi:hypothetical protein
MTEVIESPKNEVLLQHPQDPAPGSSGREVLEGVAAHNVPQRENRSVEVL